jgi:hypothetical protein
MKDSPGALIRRRKKRKLLKKTIDPNSFPHKIKKICKDCGKEKMCSWQSSFTQTGKPEYRARCDECLKRYFSKKRTTPEFRTRRNEKRRLSLKILKNKAVKYLGGKCLKCGYKKSLSALTFHHRNPDEKEFDVCIKLNDMSWEEIKKELDKCDCLCFNCHMETEEEIRNNK